MNTHDPRPPVWVGHVIMETTMLEETEAFMRQLGLRPLVLNPDVAILELRGGTHLVLIPKKKVRGGAAPFDLMVEDLRATHAHFMDLELYPTGIRTISPDHESFMVREPSGYSITFYSNHTSGQPV